MEPEKMNVDVSVIVAAYNVERYIERALISALDQDGVSVEVIVADDGSSDNTAALVAGLNDPRIWLISMAHNAGPGAARNTAIAAAKGEWLAVLDGDDAFAPGRLARCLRRARSLQADIVVDNQSVLKKSCGVRAPMFPPRRFARQQTLDLADFIAGDGSYFDSYGYGYLKPVIRADFLRRHDINYMTDIRIGEDYFLMAALLAQGARCAVEPSCGYIYTVREGSLSRHSAVADISRIALADHQFLSRYSLDRPARRAQKSREFHTREAYAFVSLVEAIKQKNPRAGLAALRHCPSAPRHLWRPVWARLKRERSAA